MRVIAGEYRGRKLRSLEGENTRPTTDKIKEAIFNMIGPYFPGGTVLDLFSGSGALAIEAVSRGITEAVCIDRSYLAIQIIEQNIALTKETEKFTVRKMSAQQAIRQLAAEGHAPFDLIFLDPPYKQQQIVKIIGELQEAGLIAPKGKVVCETNKQTDFPEAVSGLQQVKNQTYGITRITVFQKEA